jgi:hypothetical protein
VTVEPRSLGSRRGQWAGRLLAIGWAGVLVGVVGVGLTGPRPAVTEPAIDQRPISVRQDVAVERLSFGLQSRHFPLVATVHLGSPGVGPQTITTPRLAVEGRVLVRASAIRVVVAVRGGGTLDSVVLDVADADGGIRPTHLPAFRIALDLSSAGPLAARPIGPAWVVVTVYDAAGLPLGGVRRPVLIGPLAALGPRDARPLDGHRLD